MSDQEEMLALKNQGFNCSQIIVKMGLDLLGKDNPDLVKSMQGLAGGLGYTGDVCGALTGAVCLLGLYAGKGNAETAEDPRLLFMVEDLVKWFKEKATKEYGGIHCLDIVNDDSQKMAARCPVLIEGCFQKAKELLVENGFDLSGMEA
jgi:C_GCAxxG_C_C family probable redox protein